MKYRDTQPIHPGEAVRQIIYNNLPRHSYLWVDDNGIQRNRPLKGAIWISEAEFSVEYVAVLLRIGRPALSNFLNGKSALSISLATKIEEIFKYDREELLKMQLEYDLFVHDSKFIIPERVDT